MDEAAAVYRDILLREPDNSSALHLLGLTAFDAGRTDLAFELVRRSIEVAPGVADFHNNLGTLLAKYDRLYEAVEAFGRAVTLDPRHHRALRNLAAALDKANRPTEAVEAYERAIAVKLDYAEAYFGLAAVLRWTRKVARAIEALYAATRHRPDYAEAYRDLSHALLDTGRLDESIQATRRAVELRPDWVELHSNLLLLLLHDPNAGPATLLAEHRAWADRHERPFRDLAASRVFPIDRRTDRPLRIGYVSGDLRAHPVVAFMHAALARHDRARYHVVCYSNTKHRDSTTERLRALGHDWREVTEWSDDELAEQILADRIDVLIDLSGHTPDHRLLVFARRPAPVQVTYAGNPATTGLSAIDYKITDALHDPPDAAEPQYSERLYRLPKCAWCFRPDQDFPEVNPLPADVNGYVTFGSPHRLIKATPMMIGVWSRVLHAVPESRMIVLVTEGEVGSEYVLDQFAVNGIDAGRLKLVGRRRRRDFMRLYHEIDVLLDSTPFNGQTTTCDSLGWGCRW